MWGQVSKFSFYFISDWFQMQLQREHREFLQIPVSLTSNITIVHLSHHEANIGVVLVTKLHTLFGFYWFFPPLFSCSRMLSTLHYYIQLSFFFGLFSLTVYQSFLFFLLLADTLASFKECYSGVLWKFFNLGFSAVFLMVSLRLWVWGRKTTEVVFSSLCQGYQHDLSLMR